MSWNHEFVACIHKFGVGLLLLAFPREIQRTYILFYAFEKYGSINRWGNSDGACIVTGTQIVLEKDGLLRYYISQVVSH